MVSVSLVTSCCSTTQTLKAASGPPCLDVQRENMTYLELFERVAEHVRRQGVKVRFERGEPLTPVAIELERAQAFIPVPPSLLDLYAEIGSGMEFAWSSKDNDRLFANHEIPRIEECAPKSFDNVSWLPEWQDDNEFPHVKDPALAKKTALKMRAWLRFISIGNGDSFCLDTSRDPSPVLFNKHDWFDGGTGENGHQIADSLWDFYSQWAQVCFQFPRSLWWPVVFNKTGVGIDWASEEFQEPFRLPTVERSGTA